MVRERCTFVSYTQRCLFGQEPCPRTFLVAVTDLPESLTEGCLCCRAPSPGPTLVAVTDLPESLAEGCLFGHAPSRVRTPVAVTDSPESLTEGGFKTLAEIPAIKGNLRTRNKNLRQSSKQLIVTAVASLASACFHAPPSARSSRSNKAYVVVCFFMNASPKASFIGF